MVVGAGAAFSDQSKIKNTEAVDACTALNIIGGYPDGSFKPEGNITRAEVTKMICVALNGGKEPNLATNATPTFSDVRTNANSAWAEKYIESCYAQGIVSGVGGGKFAPAGNVTGTQLAKMLLVSLGYKSENEGFTGNAWATNVNTIASAKGLYEGLEKLDVSAALTRDSAARMIWNALQAYEVEYKTTLTTDKNGQLTSQITVQDKVVGSNNDKITLLRDKYDAWVNVGTLVGVSSNEITLTMSDADQTASDLVNYIGTGSQRQADPTIKFSKLTTDYSSLVGQRVKVIFKNGKVNDVIGVYATSDNTVYNTLMNKVELDGSKIKFDGKSYSIDEATTNGKNIKVITDGRGVVNTAIDPTFKDTATNKVSMNEVTFIDSDDNGKIDTAIITTKKPAKVTYASSSEIVAGETYKYEDENIDKDFAKDDYAVISENLYKDCKNVVKAQVLNDTIKGYKSKDGYVQYQIGSTWYNAEKQITDVDTGDKVKAYVYNGIALDISSDDSNGALPSIAVVTGLQGADSTLYGNQVKLTFLDGTTQVVALDKAVKVDASTKNETEIKPTIGTAYSYTSSKDGYKLTQLENKKYNDYQALDVIKGFDNYSYSAKTSPVTQNGIDFDESAGTLVLPNSGKDKRTHAGTYKVADSAVVVMVQDSGKVKVITGKQYNSLTESKAGYVTAAFTKKVDGLNKVAILAAYVNDVDATGKSNDNYGYIVSDGYKTGDNYTAYTIWTGEKNVEVTEKVNYPTDGTGKNVRLKGMVVGYSNIDADGYINDVNPYTATAASSTLDTTHMYYGGIQGVSGTSWVTVDGENKLNITKDTKILNIDSAADKDEEIGKQGTALLTAQEIANSGEYYVNAYYILDEAFGTNDNADLAFIVVDLKGKMDGKNKLTKNTVSASSPLTAASLDVDSNATLEAGKTYKLTLKTADALATKYDVTLVGAVFADTSKTTQVVKLSTTETTVNIIATGNADVAVSAVAHT